MLARFSLAFAAGTAALLATPALAEPEMVSVTVSASDLDLATEKGRARLDRRIRHAADAICESRSGGLAARADYLACRDASLAEAGKAAADLAARKTSEIRLARNTR